jgi:hypothetical protein
MITRRWLLSVAAAFHAACSAALAQSPSAFDVAVIKPADPNATRFGMGFGPNGRTLTVDGLNLVIDHVEKPSPN